MFLTPWFLLASAIGAVVPLVLHLIRNRRSAPMDFPTLRFLLEARNSSSRNIRMQNFLLWLIRTLIMILLGAAFAMPALRSDKLAWLGDTPRDVALVIDASPSMHYRVGRQSVWEQTREAVNAVVESLGENDKLCIFLAGEQPEPVIAEPRSIEAGDLKMLEARDPGVTVARLRRAVDAAGAALR